MSDERGKPGPDPAPAEEHPGEVDLPRLLAERRRSEQAVRDSDAQLRAVINTAVDGIITIDDHGIIQWLNPAALRIFGYTAGELIGKNVKVLMPEPDHSRHDGYLGNYLRTGQAKIIGIGREVVGLRKDGSTFPMDLAISEVPMGERRLFTGMVRDITQRKEAEQALRVAKEAAEHSARRAEEASRAKDHFLAVVSHELRTPLMPILATAALLLERGDLPPEVCEDVATIRRNAEQEARFVEDLLNLTRLSRGKLSMHFEVVDAHATLRNAIAQFKHEIDVSAIDLSADLQAEEPHVWADPGRIQQVFSNLLSNAVKFTPAGGRISVRTNNLEDKLQVEICDTGAGIEPAVLPRLFNAFEQGEQTVTRKFGGLGLGLAIAKGIVDLHQGSITARSEGRGQGATFLLELKNVPQLPRGARADWAAAGVPTKHRRILLVEDHADTLKIMSKLLASFGYEVSTASSVHDALTLIATQPFDLLVSDIGLPDGSGLDIMRTIKAMQHINGIALSGFGQDEDLRRSREAGFVEHLVKPVSFQQLRNVVQRLAS